MASDRTLKAKAYLSNPSFQTSGNLSTVLRGVGIASIAKTSTEGLVDTYTITYTDGRTQTYEVTNGAQGERGPRGDKGPRGYTGFSAYQYAVAGGYEGTEEEFTQLMASNATMADTVENYSWTEEIKTALMDCFENVAWVNENGQTYYNALYAALYDRVWTITNTLTGCRNTNTANVITKGRPYNGILEALSAYTMEGATVSITMDAVDVTESVYSDGTISIPAVTGAVVITAEAVRTAWAVTNVLTHCTTDNDTDWVAFGEPYEATLTVAEGYEMDSVTITMGGIDVSSYYSSGTISIPAVTGDVAITARAVKVIKVFVGKGVGETGNIINNANRALSEPVPYDNSNPIVFQWDGYSADNAKASFKNTTPDINTIDNTGTLVVKVSEIGTTTSGHNNWITTTEESCIASWQSNKWGYYNFAASSGYFRLLFAGAANMSSPIPGTISGKFTIQGTTYILQEAPLSEFE